MRFFTYSLVSLRERREREAAKDVRTHYGTVDQNNRSVVARQYQKRTGPILAEGFRAGRQAGRHNMGGFSFFK